VSDVTGTTAATRRGLGPKKKQRSLPTWITVVMVVLLGVLAYGVWAPKSPNAFDSPAAQTNPQGAPWQQPRAF